jgi:hypothetical protein
MIAWSDPQLHHPPPHALMNRRVPWPLEMVRQGLTVRWYVHERPESREYMRASPSVLRLCTL